MVMASRGPLLRPSRASLSPITAAQPRHHIRGNHSSKRGLMHQQSRSRHYKDSRLGLGLGLALGLGLGLALVIGSKTA